MYGFSKNLGLSTNINAASLEVHNFFILRGIFRNRSDRKKTKETAKRRKSVSNCSTKVQTTKQLVDQNDCFSAQQSRRRLEQRVNGKKHNRLERSDSNPVQMVNFTLELCCKSCHIYTGISGHQVGALGAESV